MDASGDSDDLLYVLFRNELNDYQVAIFNVSTGDLVSTISRDRSSVVQFDKTLIRPREAAPDGLDKTLMRLREAARDGRRPFLVESKDEEVPSALIFPSSSQTKLEEFKLEYVYGNLKVKGNVAVALPRPGELEVIQLDARSRPISIRFDRSNLIDFGMLGGSRLYVAYSNGLVEILDGARTQSINTGMTIRGISWSPSHHEFVVFGGLDEANLRLKWFDVRSGVLIRSMEYNAPISDLQLLNSTELLVVSAGSYSIIPGLHVFAKDEELARYAMAITPRWLLDRDLEEEGALTFAPDKVGGGDNVLEGIVTDCSAPKELGTEEQGRVRATHTPLGVLYAQACGGVKHSPGSEGFRAFEMARLEQSYLVRANRVTDITALPQELVGLGEDDPVATAMLGARLQENEDYESGCAGASLSRRLLENSIFHGVVAPEFIWNVLRCGGVNAGNFSKEIVKQIRALAEAGDPIAYAALGIISEWDDQPLENALAHYQVASLILHAMKQAEKGFGETSATWVDVERVIGLRRATLARLLGPVSAVDALGRAQNAFEQAQSRSNASSPVRVSSFHPISALSSTLSPADFSTAVTKAEQKLRSAASASEVESVIRLSIEGRYIAAEQYDRDDARASDQRVADLRALRMEILDSATDLRDLDSFSYAVSPVVLRLLKLNPGSDRYIELLRDVVDHVVDGNTPIDARTLTSDQQKRLLDLVMGEPIIKGDNETSIRLTLALMSVIERDSSENEWAALADVQERVRNQLSHQADLLPFKTLIANLEWNYVKIGSQLGDSLMRRDGRFPGEVEGIGRKILDDGIKLQSMVQEMLPNKRRLAEGFIQAAYVTRADGKYDELIGQLDKVIQLDPNSPRAYYDRGAVYSAKREFDLAIRNYGQSIELNPKSALAYRSRGLAYAAKGELNRAIEDFDWAIQLDPKNIYAYRNRGTAYREMRELDRAIKDFTDAIELDPKSLHAYFERGMTYEERGEYIRAMQDYSQTTQLDAKDAGSYVTRAGAHLSKGEFDAAIKDCDRALQLNPRSVNAYVNRAISYRKKGQFDLAIEDYNRLIQLDPKNPDIYNNRGFAYATKGELDRAIQDYDRVTEINPKYVIAYGNRSDAYRDKGDVERAIQDLDRAIQINPKYVGGYQRRSTLKLYSNRTSSAIGDLSLALQLKPLDHYTVINLHIARKRSGQSDADELRTNAESLDRAKWPWPIVDLFIGYSNPEAVRAAAKSVNPTTGRDDTCEADLYLGIYEQERGIQDEARRSLESAAKNCQQGAASLFRAKQELLLMMSPLRRRHRR